MANFRTQLSLPIFPLTISHQEAIFSIGSCFAEHMSHKLASLKFSTLLNPRGILYNPISIANTLEKLLTKESFTEDKLFQNHGLWHSFDHHGSFSHPEKATALTAIRTSHDQADAFFKKSKRILITLGTAHVFVYKKTGKIVANCHKLPGTEFERRKLSVKDIVDRLSPLFENLKKQNPDLEIIVSVSPVRHIRDGLIENQRSKATLILALEALCQQFSCVHYFPAYEIQMDDLRDYRFFKADMIHPNQQAIKYIWSYFAKAFFTPETILLNKTIEKINLATRHKSFHPASAEHQAFLEKQLEAVEKMENSFPFLDFSEEQAFFTSQLS